jgi:SAM-dependent methyltransferase
MGDFNYMNNGFCPCCETIVVFSSKNSWFRDWLLCPSCSSNVRERALALVLSQIMPNWRSAAIHESSPDRRGFSLRMQREAPRYVASHYFPDRKPGEMIDNFRNENLEAQTFADGSLDLVVSLDVMEHVFDPPAVYREVYRTLRPGGFYLHTFPIRKWQVEAAIPRAERDPDGAIKNLVETPEYHGNPIDASGSLVTFDYGYNITQKIAEWAPFRVQISRFWDPDHGIIGEYTEVVTCRKEQTN